MKSTISAAVRSFYERLSWYEKIVVAVFVVAVVINTFNMVEHYVELQKLTQESLECWRSPACFSTFHYCMGGWPAWRMKECPGQYWPPWSPGRFVWDIVFVIANVAFIAMESALMAVLWPLLSIYGVVVAVFLTP